MWLALLILAGALPGARAEPSPGAATAEDGAFSEFLKLRQTLPAAVCDESVISRAPSLEAARAGVKPPVGGFRLKSTVDESRVIGFLLGDPVLPLASPYLESAWGPERARAQLAELKRKLSLEVCTSLVTPGRLRVLMDAKPSRFLPASAARAGGDENPPAGHSSFRLQDIEGRFGRIGTTWWIPGWVDPHEVESARAGKREYRRLANPVTNRLQFIVVMGRDDLPVGYVVPASEAPVTDWEKLRTAADNPGARARQAELYRLMVEGDSYRAVARAPARGEEIRKLHEFYRGVIGAYQLYPADPQFGRYAQGVRRLMSEREIRERLDRSFISAVEKAWVNGARVSFQLLLPDPRLHGIYAEFRARLRQTAP